MHGGRWLDLVAPHGGECLDADYRREISTEQVDRSKSEKFFGYLPGWRQGARLEARVWQLMRKLFATRRSVAGSK